MSQLRDIVKDDVILQRCDYLADVSYQTAVNGEGPAWKRMLQGFDSLKDQPQPIGDSFSTHQSSRRTSLRRLVLPQRDELASAAGGPPRSIPRTRIEPPAPA